MHETLSLLIFSIIEPNVNSSLKNYEIFAKARSETSNPIVKIKFLWLELINLLDYILQKQHNIHTVEAGLNNLGPEKANLQPGCEDQKIKNFRCDLQESCNKRN